MALDATKWQVTVAKVIEYTGPAHGLTGANYVTVLELHRWLQDLADAETISGDDFVAITVANPTDKKFDTIIQLLNGFVLGITTTPAAEYIFGGTIIQGTGGTEAIWDGISVIANAGVVVNVIQNNIVLANDFWNNIPFGTGVNGLNPDAANGLAMQFMVQVKTGGAFIDNGALIFTTREWGKTFSEFRIPSTGRGKNAAPLTFADDLNNTTVIGTIAGLTGITNITAGYNAIDVDNNTTDEFYYSEWDKGANSINDFYQRMKWLSRAGETTTLYGIPGERFRGITHEVTVTTPRTSTIAEGVAATWTGGSGQVLARDSASTATKVWIQLLTGVAPTAGQLITVGGGSVTAGGGSPSLERTLSTPFAGASTGSSLVGAYGFALESADLSVNDKIQALDAITRSPPNNVTFTVNGVQSGWRVLVGPESGGLINESQLSNSGLVNGAAVTTITVTEAIPANTPASTTASGGVTHLRIRRANGEWTRHAYTARSGTGPSTFTIASTDFSGNTIADGADIYIAYIDAASSGTSILFSTIQSGGNQTLAINARFGGTGPNYTDSIKPAATTGSLAATGGSATISAVSDA